MASTSETALRAHVDASYYVSGSNVCERLLGQHSLQNTWQMDCEATNARVVG